MTRMTKDEYKRYLQSPHWRALSENTKRLRQFCENENCPLSGISRDDSRDRFKYDLQVNHLNYENLGSETQDDLRVLCFKCHADLHGKPHDHLFFDENSGTMEEIYARLNVV